ncbi:hypothetical protein LB524_13755 [Mesorhizobium sp. ESP6-5]|uniref:hypothetical protein n=1 Tax=unclassified Mesorhizobium TaxID=325217 RepID=UPI00112E9182|nr:MULTISPECIES: hypothetical protein [unclassified Mesorhizobium]MBZ9723793.1 hypothetical protein [Mesorhizobium sp. CO1-1-11]MBZ9756356.1 hypothetical protein [Mesorhizobium sp. ESP6-5]TPJ13369.1 hypothetical protein FJW04_21020 [Mesorhizobium sp. B2-7-3]
MKSLLFGLALLLPGVALAEPIETRKIITALTGDFNGDGAPDLAMVVETGPTDPMDIHFFLGDKEHNYLKPVEIVREQIGGEWNGYDRPGYENSNAEPELTMLPNGSIKFHLPAPEIGSERTNQTLTVAYRNGAFIVAGFAYDSDDYLQENAASACDYNVLTGKGTSSKQQPDGSTKHKTVSAEGKTIAFRDWNSGDAFAACQE